MYINFHIFLSYSSFYITTFLLAADNTVEYILAELENYRVHSA